MRVLLLPLLLTPGLALAFSFPKDTPYQVCFTPQHYCTGLIDDHIYAAKKSIYVQAYSFTSRNIAKALVRAAKRGVKVYVILDKSNFQKGRFSFAGYLAKNHIPIWNDNQLRIAHNKVMIFDGTTVETGSFNFTYSAQKHNAENVLIIQSKPLAQQYLQNWFARQKRSIKVSS